MFGMPSIKREGQTMLNMCMEQCEGVYLMNEIERLREEVKELEEIMEENKCAVGYLITKRVLKQHGMWKEAMEATRQILRDDNV